VCAADLLLAGERRWQKFSSRQVSNSRNHRPHTIRPLRVSRPRIVLQAIIVVEYQGFHGSS
jgi:hypothetical protein